MNSISKHYSLVSIILHIYGWVHRNQIHVNVWVEILCFVYLFYILFYFIFTLPCFALLCVASQLLLYWPFAFWLLLTHLRDPEKWKCALNLFALAYLLSILFQILSYTLHSNWKCSTKNKIVFLLISQSISFFAFGLLSM